VPVLLGQVHGELVQHGPVATAKRAEEAAVTCPDTGSIPVVEVVGVAVTVAVVDDTKVMDRMDDGSHTPRPLCIQHKTARHSTDMLGCQWGCWAAGRATHRPSQ
jgi:hypothetical protein